MTDGGNKDMTGSVPSYLCDKLSSISVPENVQGCSGSRFLKTNKNGKKSKVSKEGKVPKDKGFKEGKVTHSSKLAKATKKTKAS